MQEAKKITSINRVPAPVRPPGAPAAQREPAQHLKKAKLVLIVAACFVLSLVVVGQYASLVFLNYQLSEARSELAAVREDTRMKEVEVARLSSLGRVETVAREELDMVKPEAEQVNIISARQRAERESDRPGE